MSSAKSAFFRDSSFDSFLFAVIGEERSGMALSVVSALARLDMDPWTEAAALSGQSAASAEKRLTGLLSSLPSGQLVSLAPETVRRLVALLPRSRPDAMRLGGAIGLAKSTKFRRWSNMSSWRF